MVINSEGILLRPWLFSDAKSLAIIADNKRISDNLRDGFPFPYSLRDARDWLNLIIPENQPTRFFAIVVEDELAGSIGLVTKTDIYRKNIEIGYFLGERFWGKGIATKAIKAVTDYGFREFDVERIYAEPFSDNAGSRRALEKAGYVLEASLKRNVIKNEIIKDSCIYSILR